MCDIIEKNKKIFIGGSMKFTIFISEKFDINGTSIDSTPITEGLINSTYKISTDSGKDYILQKINTNVFKNPDELMQNIENVCKYISARVDDPEREAMTVIRTKDGKLWYRAEDGGCWRVYKFIGGAKSIQAAENEMSLYYAAKAFGKFQRLLGDYDASTLFETIPNFHNTVSRFADFKAAVEHASPERRAECEKEIEQIYALEPYAHMIVDGLANGKLPLRVTHNDTKLNNVMLDNVTGEGVCVIDLDTVMPGSLLYDFGDGVRFAACNSAEDERDLSKVYHRLDLFEQYTHGFLDGIGANITENERDMLPVSVVILTYELVLRFLGDYLNGDIYFRVAEDRPKHNLERGRAQLKLTLDTISKLDEMKKIVEKYSK